MDGDHITLDLEQKPQHWSTTRCHLLSFSPTSSLQNHQLKLPEVSPQSLMAVINSSRFLKSARCTSCPLSSPSGAVRAVTEELHAQPGWPSTIDPGGRHIQHRDRTRPKSSGKGESSSSQQDTGIQHPEHPSTRMLQIAHRPGGQGRGWTATAAPQPLLNALFNLSILFIALLNWQLPQWGTFPPPWLAAASRDARLGASLRDANPTVLFQQH